MNVYLKIPQNVCTFQNVLKEGDFPLGFVSGMQKVFQLKSISLHFLFYI